MQSCRIAVGWGQYRLEGGSYEGWMDCVSFAWCCCD